MKNLRNVIIIFVLILGVGGYFSRIAYNKMYKAPRIKNAETKKKIQADLTMGRQTLATMTQFSNRNMSLYTRSFPVNVAAGRTEYQIWLTQLAEFCGMNQPEVKIGQYRNGAGSATLQFQLQAKSTMEGLYRFLYEFYWTSFMHRITSMDVQTVEKSELLSITFVFEGLIMMKWNPRYAYPLAEHLPATTIPFRRLTSGTLAAYAPAAQKELFRYTPPSGIDAAQYAILTGIPTATDSVSGKTLTQTRWKLVTDGKTITRKVGERLTVGSFDGTIEDIFEDMVILKQMNGTRWVLMLGENLNQAAAVPPNLF